MPSVKERLAQLRESQPWLDHTLKMLAHYGAVNGNGQAGAVTYFGFLSFFPILALAVFAIGIIAQVYPDIRPQMTAEIENLVPGVIGDGTGGTIALSDVDQMGGGFSLVGIIALAGLLYTGLGWLSGMRLALEAMFVVPRAEQPNFVFGKLRDLSTLALIGVVLMISVVLSGAVTGFSEVLLGLLGIDPDSLLPAAVLQVLARLLAVGASVVLLMTMFKLLLVESHCPRNALLRGALLGAVGFEILKLLANLLLAQTRGNPAFQAFGVALILLVWINYFSRLVMYAAAWAYTSPDALAQRTAEATIAPGASLTEHGDDGPPRTSAGVATREAETPSALSVAGATAVVLLGVASIARGLRRR